MNLAQPITVRLGEDLNWWVQSNGDTGVAQGVLDPRQVTHLKDVLDAYRPFGYQPQWFAAAFWWYRLDTELPEGRLRLVAAEDEAGVFALPMTGGDEESPYLEFLEAIRDARVRKLNAENHYIRDCTEEEMIEELSLIDADRYFSADVIHVFNEISEILEWSPAQWDDSSS